jgi:hypothetical protein
MIIFIFIFIVILYLLYNLEDDTPKQISQPIINSTEVKQYIKKKTNKFLMEYNTSPVFRGLSKSSIIQAKNEIGGSKIFKNVKIDNSNLTNNLVNYKNYSSYRIKPYSNK